MFRPKTNKTIPKFGSTFSQEIKNYARRGFMLSGGHLYRRILVCAPNSFRTTLLQRVLSDGIATAWIKPYVESSQARCCSNVIFTQTRSPCMSFQCETRRVATKARGLYYFVKLTLTRFLVNSPDSRKNLHVTLPRLKLSREKYSKPSAHRKKFFHKKLSSEHI